ncbi:MAG: 16S rRNA (guanine(966)-N(2))-methyltransferase RsmD [Rhodospirillaceae bacterium]|jgi:16S rRNA (guanine966-N2)-methyltransferase|nr:16S rRNA (guanine(966)-N(2))-methyltransferase RsmD [Rhodospirillaceae bacterium]MBT3495477.1 16S rRNA (guanine(966)-N(2))-methyltransferase RsmD [Rhodospirillaceae bacterium]MBT3780093.1 16S rRNA (guanine(966)-N(2))-methyltransferase RsmD [Rhodospirillaceae bacterium]MBT3975480.1 16S rRNA (guanine(966)-N(2))-methyltransferase RsmD [Rhodospirillaceae bacterium]MBT4170788.1 16S rRNA (guanine(966)-N(2))-methyltransferase RsmD [Rhodospirillaceae bacterium]
MRIVGGKHRGRRLNGPAGMDIRPTSDRAREALFNILSHGDYAGPDGAMPENMSVIDVFAGTGALGLEALSRGAATICFMEQNRTAARAIQDTAREMDAADQVNVLTRDATRPGQARDSFDLVLMDAPYRTGQSEPSLRALADLGWLHEGTICCIELAKKEAFEAGADFSVLDERTYGAARIVLLRWDGAD